MLPTTGPTTTRPDPGHTFRAAHRVRGGYMMGGQEREALADLVEVLGLAGSDLPVEVLSALDRSVALLLLPTRPPWRFGFDPRPSSDRPLHGSPDTP